MAEDYKDWVFTFLATMSPWLAIGQLIGLLPIAIDTLRKWQSYSWQTRTLRIIFSFLILALSLERFSSAALTRASLDDEPIRFWATLTIGARLCSGLAVWSFVALGFGWYLNRKGT